MFSLVVLTAVGLRADEPAGVLEFRAQIKPVLQEFCYDCHGDGAKKGDVALDAFDSDAAALNHPQLWLKALQNLRSGIMPPPKKPQPSQEQKQRIEHWIKTAVFRSDPANPDPGRVTVRRLNRVEYRNTIRDLLGVDFDTEKEFPADDAGHGFDNIGDVLTLPPMLLEKYIAAAQTVVKKAVPSVPLVPAEKLIPGKSFIVAQARTTTTTSTNRNLTGGNPNALALSYYEPATASASFNAEHAGRYELLLDFSANERFVDNQFDYNKCRLVFRVDGQELHSSEYTREGNKSFHYEFQQQWQAGPHELVLEVNPLTPDQRQVRSLTLRIDGVTVRGPLDSTHWVRPKNYERFFPRETPQEPAARRQYAREILEPFLKKAYRRPVDPKTVDRLVDLTETISSQPGKTFESGIGQAMVAMLASPRFLFREEGVESVGSASSHPLIDEHALASRLSYFLWSTMPDDELIRLADERKLRAHLPEQLQRLIKNARFGEFVRNFTGQWLQTRDVESIGIDARQVLAREAPVDPDFERRRQRFRELREKPEEKLTPEEKKEMADMRGTFFRRFGQPLRAEMTPDVRRAMRWETERTFEYIVRQDRPLLELIDSDYTFLNERLARHYSLTNLNVAGDEMRLVKLPPGNPRGGVLTHGSVLTVTSNPTRTSPVKRGLFILDNLLGTPPAPPPPDITPLEDAAKGMSGRTVSLREMLALHRAEPLCSSCHNRMDPLGLALENFNAMGMWRDQERGLPIDASSSLLSGETFNNVIELKRILVTNHSIEFYRTITEKLLTYALGRGLDYYDVMTVDQIVDKLVKSGGRPSVLLTGIIESAPFQKTRLSPEPNPKPATLQAEAKTKQ